MEEYRLLVRPGAGEWLQPYLGARMRRLEAVRPEAPPSRPVRRRRVVAGLRRRVGRGPANGEDPIPPSKGVAEAFGADVVHLPTQQGFRTDIPTIYHPWDLQHVHHPEFFEPSELRERDRIYRTLCRQARVVACLTRWGAEDVIENLNVPRRKVVVIPAAVSVAARAEPGPRDLARVREAYELPDRFVVYPAQTWPHKNHLALVDALSLLARQERRITVVCPGLLNDFHPTIERRAREAGVADRLRFLGYVPDPDVNALYRLAQALVFPSLYEGWGFPILEAFYSGLPVACSDIPPVREVVGDAAATFDPASPEDLAETLLRVWTDEGLRRHIADRGRARCRRFSWERVARLARAHYRRVGGGRLDTEDRALIRESRA